MRRYSIDELPQLWNVLKGDMSLVGPRPPLPFETGFYTARDWQRLRVKPGVTGLWQVTGRCTTSFREMVDLDIRYWESWSFGLELSILLRTPWIVVTGSGAA
jgi:lipopolysaccharide/colanic/teichoic acid biosynthesis glycosyltransferase